MPHTLEPTLALLDEGLRFYRRNWGPLLILAAILAFPLGLLAVALLLSADWLASGWGALLTTLMLVAGLPLGFYVLGAMSRATLLATNEGRLQLRDALAIGPLRVLGMGCYGTLVTLVVGIVIGTLSTICLCVGYIAAVGAIVGAVAVTTASGTGGTELSAALAVLGGAVFLLIYLGSLALNGMVYGSVVYGLQPFLHSRSGFGEAVSRSVDLFFFRFGQNLLAFLGASLVYGAVTLAATLVIGALIPLPALFLLGSESLVAQAIAAATWVCGAAVTLPLLPIWMALLYRQRLAEREGSDLEARLAALAAPAPVETPSAITAAR